LYFCSGSRYVPGKNVRIKLSGLRRHPVPDTCRLGEIRVCCTGTPENVTVEIADSAPAFDSLRSPGADRGIGIAFVRQAADIVTYRHKDHRNILTLVKVRRV